MDLISTETKPRNFKSDMAWSEKFKPQIKRILGEIFISDAPLDIDQKEATDLMVFEIRPFRIACRIRGYNYFKKYPNEFTIRSYRPSGIETELEKIFSGWGDYYFYGFSNQNENDLVSYSIFDLKVFRREHILYRQKKHLKYSSRSNDDGVKFLAYDLRSFPKDFIIKRFSQEVQLD